MLPSPSLVIRGGTIVDGSGGDTFEADVTVAGGRITAVGKSHAKGAGESDAKGKPVTPAGGKRLIQRTNGFDATIVSGPTVYRSREATGALSGRLVRGMTNAPG